VSEVDGRRSGILLRADLLSVAANPDLTVQWNYLKQTCKTSDTTKCKINGSFIIQNTGNQKAGSSSIDFYLSDDDQYDGGDTFLERISTGPINAGNSVVKKLIYRLPAGESASGKYIIAVIDPEDVVTELDESNNEVPFPTSCPDLVICMIAQFFSKAVTVGSIPTSTCYEFWSGCKPWNCEGDTTNQKYWDRECWNRFPNECTKENDCRAAYPLW